MSPWRPRRVRPMPFTRSTSDTLCFEREADIALPVAVEALRETLELARQQRLDLSLVSSACRHHRRGDCLLAASAVVEQLLTEALAWLNKADAAVAASRA